ncbi:molybdopterin synthase catalytic subunit MoaE [Aestuariirhabdus litorea]|uniref:Molybdopterin synthase catalytic subunit n=1 Tax=Aestuariirhabdus litorea TaxID=2528527 RepID=A0A3P3VS46_9GAMM|nr:molybdopterin synthase catalytic subunit MoaE [Aestuariirhabdus litorea]RRJ84798.1 molybdopterin synthase catalytic subunit MoaE [Aestuariirhabdus litorea]RWW98021.1 molybdopterin synthase catalytic subunit MoaE [Endozoicomonadaceae bacterium GTF-13]
MKIQIQQEDFSIEEEVAALRAGQPSVGAVVTFTGVVRDLNLDTGVSALELECYPAMVEKTLSNIVAEAMQRWQVMDATVIHRIGRLEVEAQIVFVGVTSLHRGDAFAACEFIMDFLKTDAPFWKKEHSVQGARWLDARSCDQQARHRWDSSGREE